jgi:malonyl-CoA decarboxylase
VPDPVANFHLSNGACVDALHWRANPEDYGLRRSWGVMVSYRYDPVSIASNAEGYADGTLVATSEAVERLAAGLPDQRTQGGASSGSMS